MGLNRQKNNTNPAGHCRGAEEWGTCAFIDAEHALDPIYAQALGVDIENLLVSQPDTGEQALKSATWWLGLVR